MPGRGTRTLAPHSSYSLAWLAVLRSQTIIGRAIVEMRGRNIWLTTPALHPTVARARQPSWQIVRSARLALLVRPQPSKARLYFRDLGSCNGGGWLSRGWHVASGDRIRPQMCPRPSKWYIEAGYLGRSLVMVSFPR